MFVNSAILSAIPTAIPPVRYRYLWRGSGCLVWTMLAAAGLLSLAASSQQQDAEDALLPQSEPLDEPSPRDLFRKLFEEPPVREPNEEQLLNGTDEGISPSGERSKLLITGHAAWKLKPLHGQGEKF